MTIPAREVVHTEKAPKAIGPYSQAIKTEVMVMTAGQIGLDPATGELVGGGIQAQTRQVLTNLRNVLEASGSEMGLVLKTIVFIKDMQDFAQMNAVYGEFFSQTPPARSTVAVVELPKGALVEIEATGLLKAGSGK